jgi:hypothetical protein
MRGYVERRCGWRPPDPRGPWICAPACTYPREWTASRTAEILSVKIIAADARCRRLQDTCDARAYPESQLVEPSASAGLTSLRQGYGDPPKLRAKAEDLRYDVNQ